MNKTIGILAHIDAGKTTFAEQLLYRTKAIKSAGRVDHKNSFLDSHDIEKERGITVFSHEAEFTYNSSRYFLVDTPGHADFSSEMERAIGVMDYAIIILSAVEGIEGQTEIVWQLLKKHKVPAFFFINKCDREGASSVSVLKDIENNFTEDVFYFQNELKGGEMSEKLCEFLAERDEELFEKYVDKGLDYELFLSTLKRLIKERKVFPALSGAALQGLGIDEFLYKLDLLTYTNYEENGDLEGTVFKINHDKDGKKLTFIKALKGSIKVKDSIFEEENISEKIDEIRFYNGSKFKISDRAAAGEIFAITGVKNLSAGDFIGGSGKKAEYEMLPVMKSKVIFDEKLNPKEVLNSFKLLQEEDPALNVVFDEKTREIQVHIMGTIEIEVLRQLVLERFNLKVDFGPCEILYKETILDEGTGCGHFEPLKHYAEVHLLLQSGERNTGISFNSTCHVDDLSINYQKLIKSHIFEREHHGILTGSPLTDIKIRLIAGRSHIKHTSSGDFREATMRALRQGLEKTKNVLLEPYYKFKIKADLSAMGRILSDIQKMKGSFEAPVTSGDKVIICGSGPVSTFVSYATEFAEITKGRGKISFMPYGYDFCHNEEEVIKKFNYDKNADSEYTSASIFCTKGQSYTVSGCEAEKYMHCLK